MRSVKMFKTIVCFAIFYVAVVHSHHHHWDLEQCKKEFNYEGHFHPDDWPLTNQTACITACLQKRFGLMLPNNTYNLSKAMEMVSWMEKCNETRAMMMNRMNMNNSTNSPHHHSHTPPPCPTKEMVDNIKRMFTNCISDKQTAIPDQCDAAMKMNKCFHDLKVKYNIQDMKSLMPLPPPPTNRM